MLFYDHIKGEIYDTGEGDVTSRRVAALQAEYAALEKAFEEYRKRVERSIGKEAEEALYALAKAHGVSVEDLYKVL
jgi:hypothetical protein